METNLADADRCQQRAQALFSSLRDKSELLGVGTSIADALDALARIDPTGSTSEVRERQLALFRAAFTNWTPRARACAADLRDWERAPWYLALVRLFEHWIVFGVAEMSRQHRDVRADLEEWTTELEKVRGLVGQGQ